jgi:hypothetical protein
LLKTCVCAGFWFHTIMFVGRYTSCTGSERLPYRSVVGGDKMTLACRRICPRLQFYHCFSLPIISLLLELRFLSPALLNLSFSLKFREDNCPLEAQHSLIYPDILLIDSSFGKDFRKCNTKDDREGQHSIRTLQQWKQEVLGRTNRIFSWYDTGHIEYDASNNSSIVACVFVTAVTFLQSRCLETIGGCTDTHRQQLDLVSLLYFFELGK